MEPELYNQLRGLQKSARELRQGGQRARQYILLTLLSWYWVNGMFYNVMVQWIGVTECVSSILYNQWRFSSEQK